MNACKKRPHAIETKQTQVALQPNSFDEVLGDVGTLTSWKYDEDVVREALVQMIIIDELSFRFVDGEGFRRFMKAICLDNASSNDVAISYLKKKLANWGVNVANSTYLHMRYSFVSLKPKFFLKHHYKKQKLEALGGVDSKTKLEVYLSEAIQEDKEDFNVLKWWKINSKRFPILGKMASDILVAPVLTIALESAFSTDERVLDAFSNSLTPKIVEGLICAQDWLRSSNRPISIEEDLEELKKLEEGVELIHLIFQFYCFIFSLDIEFPFSRTLQFSMLSFVGITHGLAGSSSTPTPNY
ncbi:hypothetical protein GH714_043142 [Hevea brasiliensis]|uniref:HAT C-terminal dimerisation domain-containing protein n=1 Tax=Hevea brasiliensis TaxID=3981 RepID=A0A6A6K2G6_HEVBR|nr:hypothetical protein GH714_043142 [Hevea brasiliensis]